VTGRRGSGAGVGTGAGARAGGGEAARTWAGTGGGEVAVSPRSSAVDIPNGVVMGRLGCVGRMGCRTLDSWWWPVTSYHG
jgi:hypothetical protein